MLSMTSDELGMLANHMGHSLHVHANHYRLQTDILERTKVARILLAVDAGTWKRHGKAANLEDVTTDEVPVVIDGERKWRNGNEGEVK